MTRKPKKPKAPVPPRKARGSMRIIRPLGFGDFKDRWGRMPYLGMPKYPAGVKPTRTPTEKTLQIIEKSIAGTSDRKLAKEFWPDLKKGLKELRSLRSGFKKDHRDIYDSLVKKYTPST